MTPSPYMKAAEQATQHENAEEFDLAAAFWHRAETVALKPINQRWATTRAELCEKRHTLAARQEIWRESAQYRALKASATKEEKRQVEALAAHMHKTTNGEQ